MITQNMSIATKADAIFLADEIVSDYEYPGEVSKLADHIWKHYNGKNMLETMSQIDMETVCELIYE